MTNNITVFQQQGNLCCSGGSAWTCGYDIPQKYSVEITATNEADYGEVGLVQNLVKSNRIATYKNGVIITIVPQAGVPCLDGDPECIPWYNSASHTTLSEENANSTVTLVDAPVCTVNSLITREGETSKLDRLFVEEDFLVSLYQKTSDKVLKQWLWAYKYEFVADPTDTSYYPKAVLNLDECSSRDMQEHIDELPIIKVGPVATAGVVKTLSVVGWEEA